MEADERFDMPRTYGLRAGVGMFMTNFVMLMLFIWVGMDCDALDGVPSIQDPTTDSETDQRTSTGPEKGTVPYSADDKGDRIDSPTGSTDKSNELSNKPKEIAVAGRLLVNLESFGLKPGGPVRTWPNVGLGGGDFSSRESNPEVEVVDGVRAVSLDGDDVMAWSLLMPNEVCADNAWSLEVWVYNPMIKKGIDEVMVSWAARNPQEDYQTAQFNYNDSVDTGAYVHWNGDSGWHRGVPEAERWHHIVYTYTGPEAYIESVYVDGVIDSSSKRMLAVVPGQPLVIGGVQEHKGGFLSQYNNFSGSIAVVRIHTNALTSEQVLNNFQRDVERFRAVGRSLPEGGVASAEEIESASMDAEIDRKHGILLVDSYHQGYYWTDEVGKGIYEELKSDEHGVDYYFEYLDSKRNAPVVYKMWLGKSFKMKYQYKKIDLIVTDDDDALEYVLNDMSTFFSEIPVVFCAVDPDYDLKRFKRFAGITGVRQSISLKDTLELALRVHPDIEQIGILKYSEEQARKEIDNLGTDLPKDGHNREFTNYFTLSGDDVYKRLGSLPEKTVVIFYDYPLDDKGKIVSISDAVSSISRQCPVPVYSHRAELMGYGVLGSVCASPMRQGRMVGKQVRRILEGDSIRDVAVVTDAQNQVIFDYEQMKRFGISRGDLPDGIEIINEPYSFYAQYRNLILSTISVILGLAGVVFILTINTVRRRRAERALMRARDELEDRVEERTEELARTNIELEREMIERMHAEDERRQMEKQILQAQKLESLGVLAGGIAHDFNNLLMGILGNADLAMYETPPGSRVRVNLMEIEIASKRAADLCNQMLAYSGKGRFIVESLDVNGIVNEMQHLLRVSISKFAEFKCYLGKDMPLVEADPTQIRQIVMNLITNASEAIGEKDGIITISTGTTHCDGAYLKEMYIDDGLPEGDYVYVEVADTGCGMDKETLEKIFEPFYTTKFTGRGLGLAAVLGIVRSHKGGVKVRSEIGKGTTFTVILPVDKKKGFVRPVREPKDSRNWVGTGTVLLVDDEETVRSIGQRMLRQMGFDVLLASDGLEGVDLFREHLSSISCVVLDLTMPHMDGREAFREMRALRADVPVIISSGYNEEEISQQFGGPDRHAFIQKPYRAAELRSKLREILESSLEIRK